MSKPIPTPEEIKKSDRQTAVLADDSNVSLLLSGMTGKEKSFALQMLVCPGRSDVAMAKEAGYAVGKNSKVSAIKKRIKGKLGGVLAEMGVDELDIGKVLKNCLQAEKTFVTTRRIYSGGQVINEEVVNVSVPDFAIQLKTAQLLIKTGGYEAPTRHEITANIEHAMSDHTMDELRNREKYLEEKHLEIEADCEIN